MLDRPASKPLLLASAPSTFCSRHTEPAVLAASLSYLLLSQTDGVNDAHLLLGSVQPLPLPPKKRQMPPAILKLIRSASPEDQGRVHDLIWAMYGVLKFVPGAGDDEVVYLGDDAVPPDGEVSVQDSETFKVWADPDEPEPKSEDAGNAVAAAIREAAKAATGTSGAPSELAYIDAGEAEAQVRRLMEERAEVRRRGAREGARQQTDGGQSRGVVRVVRVEQSWIARRPSVV